LIFVDVDGVLIPFQARANGTGRRSSEQADAAPDGCGHLLLRRLDPSDGRRLLALPGNAQPVQAALGLQTQRNDHPPDSHGDERSVSDTRNSAPAH
jgi:hypothetical protein